MKVSTKLAVLLSLGVLPVLAQAKTEEQTYLETCRRDPGTPVPLVVVSPHVGLGHEGETVDLEFTVDTSGKPTGFSVKSDTDRALSDLVLEAVKQWQFAPAQRDGEPVATKVLLPVRIVDDAYATTR